MINDFGEKIGGARKDIWKLRGLMLEDLEDMTSGEKDKYVKKDCIWPKEDMKANVAAGEPRFVVYFRNEVRKWIHPQPKNVAAESYIVGVRKIRALAEAIKEENDIPVFMENLISTTLVKVRKNHYDYIGGYRGIIKGQVVLNYHSNTKLNLLKKKMIKEHFCMTDEEIMSNDYPLIFIDGETYSIETERGHEYVVQKVSNGKIFYHPEDGVILEPNRWIVLMGNHIFFSHKDKKECEKEQQRLFAVNNAYEKAKSKAKKKDTWIPPQFDRLNRTGTDFRYGKHVSGEDFINTFHIRGGEFGNWTNEKERQTSLDMAYDAFYDMAEVLNIRAEDISLPYLSLNGLAIAFGARGRGQALAHYEKALEVINLTKLRGAGSLAHEWGHALDDMIGQVYCKSSDFATEAGNQENVPESFAAVMNAIRYKKDSRNYSDYYRGSARFATHTSKSGHGYWASKCELFARAFACYVKDKLSEKGKQNDYLCGHADTCYKKDEAGNFIYAYPRGEERAYINEKFDQLFSELRKSEFKPFKYPEVPKKITTLVHKANAVAEEPSYYEAQNGQMSFFSFI